MELKANKFKIPFYLLKKTTSIFSILVLAAILFFYQIGYESLWLDEVYSLNAVANKGYLNLNRPLYFLLLKGWMYLGESEAWLRSLSVIFGLISVWLIYRLGYRLVNRQVGLIAALLTTLSPLVINHSQEVRMYMLSMCLGIAGSLLLTYVLDGWQRKYIIAWFTLRLLGILATPINLLMLLPDTLIIGWQLRHQMGNILKWAKKYYWLLALLAFIAVFILKDVIPPLIIFLQDLRVENTIGITAFVGAITKFTIWNLESPVAAIRQFYEPIFLNLYALSLIFLLGVIIFWYKPKKLGIYWIAIWGFVPLITLFALAQIVTTIWGVTRYLLFTAPYIYLLLATGFTTVWRKQKILALIIAMMYAIAISGSLVNYYGKVYREDWRSAVNTINLEEKAGDRIVLFPSNHLSAFEYYYQGTNQIQTIERFSLEQLRQPINQESGAEFIQELPSLKSRLWLVIASAHQSIRDPQRIIPNLLQEQFRIAKNQQFKEIELFLLENNKS